MLFLRGETISLALSSRLRFFVPRLVSDDRVDYVFELWIKHLGEGSSLLATDAGVGASSID